MIFEIVACAACALCIVASFVIVVATKRAYYFSIFFFYFPFWCFQTCWDRTSGFTAPYKCELRHDIPLRAGVSSKSERNETKKGGKKMKKQKHISIWPSQLHMWIFSYRKRKIKSVKMHSCIVHMEFTDTIKLHISSHAVEEQTNAISILNWICRSWCGLDPEYISIDTLNIFAFCFVLFWFLFCLFPFVRQVANMYNKFSNYCRFTCKILMKNWKIMAKTQNYIYSIQSFANAHFATATAYVSLVQQWANTCCAEHFGISITIHY